jgi:hypothetical protein
MEIKQGMDVRPNERLSALVSHLFMINPMENGTSHLSGRGLRAIYLLIAIIPYGVGLLCTQLTAVSFAPHPRLVVMTVPVHQHAHSRATKIVDEIQRSRLFSWSVVRSDNPASILKYGSAVAVVSISSGADSRKQARGPQAQAIAINPRGIEQDAQMYAALVQIVSESASRVGITDLFESVAGARIKLDVASITTAGIDGALTQASSSLDQAVDSFGPVMSQFEPTIAKMRTILNSYQAIARSLNAVADRLTWFAREIGSLNATLGEVEDGLQLSAAALNDLRPTLSQGLPLADSLAESLKNSGSPNVRLLGDQVGIILQLLSIESENSFASEALRGISIVSSADLSRLLGANVEQKTKISDFLLIAAKRLRYFSASIGEAKRTFDGVDALLASAEADLPKTRETLSSELEKFKVIVSKLSKTLDAATSQLPDTSKKAVDAATGRLRLSGAANMNLKETSGPFVVLLLGALAIALFTDNPRGMSVLLRRIIRLGACLGLGLVALLSIEVYGHFWLVAGVATLIAISMTELCSLLILLLGRWGIALVVALVGITQIDHDKVPGLGTLGNALPSYYVDAGLRDAIYGFGSGLAMIVAILITSGIASSVIRRQWSKSSFASSSVLPAPALEK